MAPKMEPSFVNAMDRKSVESTNLSVLKRIDPQIDQMLTAAGHVALYDYDLASGSWSHKGIEGTLFLVKRRSAPSYQYIVLNKKSQDHFVEDIFHTFKFEQAESDGKFYILYKSQPGAVIGIWFYDKSECLKVVAILRQITTLLSGISAEPVQAVISQPQVAHPLLAALLGGTQEKKQDLSSYNGRELDFNGSQASSAGVPAALHQASPILSPHGPKLGANAGQASARTPGASMAAAGSQKLAAGLRDNLNAPLPPNSHGRAWSAESPVLASFPPAAGGAVEAKRSEAPSQTPPPKIPGLLKPSFFQSTPNPQARDIPSEPSPQPRSAPAAASSLPASQGHDHIASLFGPRNATLPQPGNSTPPHSVLKPRTTEGTAEQRRQSVKSAIIKAVNESDDFLDILIRELQQQKLLPSSV